MAEEKKEESQETPKSAETEQATPAPAQAAAAPAPAPAPAQAAAPKAAEKPKVEKPTNCAACNKSIRKKCYYYRNGKYFCNKRCWKTAAKKEEAPKDQAAAQAPAQ